MTSRADWDEARSAAEAVERATRKTRSLDLTGQRFGRLVAIRDIGSNTRGARLWELLCDCGGGTITTCQNLRQGNSNSCGCLKRELASGLTNRRWADHVKPMCLKCGGPQGKGARGLCSAHYRQWKYKSDPEFRNAILESSKVFAKSPAGLKVRNRANKKWRHGTAGGQLLMLRGRARLHANAPRELLELHDLIQQRRKEMRNGNA